MGQGAESCGGYEHDYDPYVDGLGCGVWTQRDGTTIHIENMTVSHLKAAKSVAQRAAQRASFSDDCDVFEDWVIVFERELLRREASKQKSNTSKPKTTPAGKRIEMICHCGEKYEARTADVNRGWGLSCSKRCASIRREYGRPPAKPAK